MEDYSESYIQNKGQYQTSVNGNIVDNTKWNMIYDGNDLDLEAKRNDEAIYMKLNNNELLKLLEIPAYHKSIDQRLEDDLHQNNTMDVRPIIIEEIEKRLPSKKLSKRSSKTPTKMSRKAERTTNSRGRHSVKRTSKSQNGSKNQNGSKSKRSSKSKSKSKSKSMSMSKRNSNRIVPDYLKTIY